MFPFQDCIPVSPRPFSLVPGPRAGPQGLRYPGCDMAYEDWPLSLPGLPSSPPLPVT